MMQRTIGTDRLSRALALAAMCFAFLATNLSAQTSAFTYQGSLSDGGSPATGLYDLRFSLNDADDALGATLGVVTQTAVPVSNGLFTVTLDFGAAAFSGGGRLLAIEVRFPSGSGVFTTLDPPQPISSAPYAIYAGAAPWSGLANIPGEIADGDDADVLSGLNCAHNQTAKWNDIAQEWQCAGITNEVGESMAFDANGTFIVPAGISRIQFQVWGAGGGGGYAGVGETGGGGGGGGSGGYSFALINVTPGESLDIAVGTGGASGTGIKGGDSLVMRSATLLMSAIGGNGGLNGQDSPLGTGGAGGTGGSGDTQNGNGGTIGGNGFIGGFPLNIPQKGSRGAAGEPVEGSPPNVSHGGSGGGSISGAILAPSQPGGNGQVFLRW